jgi:putative ABC transport system permease protein
LAAVGGYSFRLRTETGEPADARAQRVTWEFFPALQITPILGRSFTADDEVEGRHRVAILSHGFWQRRYGGAPDVVGSTIELNEERWEIVGVLPRGFAYPVSSDRPTEIAPVAFRRKRRRGPTAGITTGRHRPAEAGCLIEQAHEQMNRVAAARRAVSRNGAGTACGVVSLHHHLVGRVRPWML